MKISFVVERNNYQIEIQMKGFQRDGMSRRQWRMKANGSPMKQGVSRQSESEGRLTTMLNCGRSPFGGVWGKAPWRNESKNSEASFCD
jgi:hypothetical protein